MEQTNTLKLHTNDKTELNVYNTQNINHTHRNGTNKTEGLCILFYSVFNSNCVAIKHDKLFTESSISCHSLIKHCLIKELMKWMIRNKNGGEKMK